MLTQISDVLDFVGYFAGVKILVIIKCALFASIGLLMLAYNQPYKEYTAQLNIPEKLAPTLYRVIIAYLFIETIRLLILVFYRPQGGNRRDNFTIGIGHLSKVLYGVFAMVLILSLFNITVKEAITSLSLIAAAIVLMTKDYISNLINGMYLTFAKVINIGDNVQIDINKGKILDITLTNVHLMNDDDDIIYIPNNKVFTSEIINYTRRELKKSNIEFEIEVAYVPEVEWLEKEIINSLGDLRELIQSNSFNLKVQSIKQEFTSFKFQYVLNDPLNKEHDKKVKRHVIRFIVQLIIRLRHA